MSKLTPGPCRLIHGSTINGPFEEYPDYFQIEGGSFDDETWMSVGGHIGEVNSHLIAAAPELLNGCKVALATLAEIVGIDGKTERVLRAAIAKAKGGEQ